MVCAVMSSCVAVCYIFHVPKSLTWLLLYNVSVCDTRPTSSRTTSNAVLLIAYIPLFVDVCNSARQGSLTVVPFIFLNPSNQQTCPIGGGRANDTTSPQGSVLGKGPVCRSATVGCHCTRTSGSSV